MATNTLSRGELMDLARWVPISPKEFVEALVALSDTNWPARVAVEHENIVIGEVTYRRTILSTTIAPREEHGGFKAETHHEVEATAVVEPYLLVLRDSDENKTVCFIRKLTWTTVGAHLALDELSEEEKR